MDEKATGLIRSGGGGVNGHGDVARLTHDIDSIRSHLDGLIDELDRRRRDAMNVRLQVRRHPLPIIGSALALAGLVAAGVYLGVARYRQRRRLAFRLRRARRNIMRVVTAKSPSSLEADNGGAGAAVGKKLLAAGGQLVMAVVTRSVRKRRERR